MTITSPFPFVKIDKMELTARVNEHVRLEIRGIVQPQAAAILLQESLIHTTLTVTLPDDRQYFSGIPLKPVIERQNELYYISLSCISASYLLDISPISCSYQNTQDSYDHILQTACQQEQTLIWTNQITDQEIQRPIFRYQETTWAFTLRMAGQLGTYIIANTATKHPTLLFGRPTRPIQAPKILEYAAGYHTTNGIYYIFSSTDHFDLGDTVTVQNHTLTIVEKNSRLIHGTFENRYLLGTENGFAAPGQHLPLAGLRLTGTVLQTRGEQLKLHLDIDATQNPTEAFWFDYVPPTGNVMYVMPPIGTKARLRFCSNQDDSAIAEECIQTSAKECRELANHHKRRFTTEFKKQMAMLEQTLFFSSSDNKLELSDQKGVLLSTRQNICLTAANQILFHAKDHLDLQTQQHIYMTKRGSNSVIDFAGKEINIESLDTTVSVKKEPFDQKAYPYLSYSRSILIDCNLAKAAVSFAPQHSGERRI